MWFPDELHGLKLQFLEPDLGMAFVLAMDRHMVAGVPDAPILVKKRDGSYPGADSSQIGSDHGPRISSRYDKVTCLGLSIHQGIDHVEYAA